MPLRALTFASLLLAIRGGAQQQQQQCAWAVHGVNLGGVAGVESKKDEPRKGSTPSPTLVTVRPASATPPVLAEPVVAGNATMAEKIGSPHRAVPVAQPVTTVMGSLVECTALAPAVGVVCVGLGSGEEDGVDGKKKRQGHSTRDDDAVSKGESMMAGKDSGQSKKEAETAELARVKAELEQLKASLAKHTRSTRRRCCCRRRKHEKKAKVTPDAQGEIDGERGVTEEDAEKKQCMRAGECRPPACLSRKRVAERAAALTKCCGCRTQTATHSSANAMRSWLANFKLRAVETWKVSDETKLRTVETLKLLFWLAYTATGSRIVDTYDASVCAGGAGGKLQDAVTAQIVAHAFLFFHHVAREQEKREEPSGVSPDRLRHVEPLKLCSPYGLAALGIHIWVAAEMVALSPTREHACAAVRDGALWFFGLASLVWPAIVFFSSTIFCS